jgi:hypothetical protein
MEAGIADYIWSIEEVVSYWTEVLRLPLKTSKPNANLIGGIRAT